VTGVTGQAEEQAVARRVGGPRFSLRHGLWTLELRGDEVADIAYDGVLLLRAIRPVVRDQDWNTLPVRLLTPATASPAADPDEGVAVDVELVFESAAITYGGTLTVALNAAELVVSFDGRARTAFQRNRIGLVVLHPASEAGQPLVVKHSDGRLTQAYWPEQISPHQPFVDIAGFAWSRDNLSAELELLGDVFELEDQRNWTDASFKTYSTPLDRPFPVPVAVGEAVQQQARLHVVDHARSPRSSVRSLDVVTVGSRVVGHVPPLSLGASLYPSPAAPAALGPGYATVLVELTDLEERWPALLDAAAGQATALGADLDVRLVTADPAAVERGVALLQGRPVARIGVFDPENHLSTVPLWTALRDAAGAAGFGEDLVGGTRAHFTELNRGQQALPEDIPALTFSLTPSMHATEIPHLLDSLVTQRTVVENAIRIAAGRPVHVGPVTLARRFNAVATSGRPDPTTDALRAVDALQHTAFAGAWTLASVLALTVPGVAGLTYYETVGDRGLLRDGQEGAATLSPAGRVLALLATLTGQPVLDAAAPDDLAAMPLATGGSGRALLLADLSGRDREVLVRWGDETRTVLLASWAVAHVHLD
jgi:hypothetical protein